MEVARNTKGSVMECVNQGVSVGRGAAKEMNEITQRGERKPTIFTEPGKLTLNNINKGK